MFFGCGKLTRAIVPDSLIPLMEKKEVFAQKTIIISKTEWEKIAMSEEKIQEVIDEATPEMKKAAESQLNQDIKELDPEKEKEHNIDDE